LYKVGIADTTFARVNMAKYAIDAIKSELPSDVVIVRRTVPGIKDLPVAAKKLLDDGCDLAMAFGMIGTTNIDKMSGHEASLGLIVVQLMTGKPVIMVFVHEDEAKNEVELLQISIDRATKHGVNVCKLLRGKNELTKWAGMGIRQGLPDVGPIEVKP
jgi:riboflavin synthase